MNSLRMETIYPETVPTRHSDDADGFPIASPSTSSVLQFGSLHLVYVGTSLQKH